MAYLKPKMNKGKKYYYAVECKRINGKPRTVNQIYLGTIEQLIANKLQADSPQAAKEIAVFEFGIVATCFQLASKIGIADIIDQFVPKRDQGLSVGQYLLLAAISRAVEPISKRACWNWYQQSCLPRLMDIRVLKKDLSSQRFWDHMDKVPIKVIKKIEQAISERVIQLFNLDVRCLIYDSTNYYTFIDTFNDRNHIAKRGKNKQKRSDLRQINLALAVTRDFHIPLFHKLYVGNRNDSKAFCGIVDELVQSYKVLSRYCKDITLVYDKGNNSQKNQKKVDQSSYHFIGSLKLNSCPDLAAMSTDSKQFKPITQVRWKFLKAYRTHRIIFGQERTVIVTFSPRFYEKQNRTLLRMIKKCQKSLRTLEARLQKRLEARSLGKPMRGVPPTIKSVQAQVKCILKHQYMKAIIKVTIAENDGLVILQYELMTDKLKEIQKTRLGKTILFTDQSQWSTTEIILGYRGQYQVEDAFKITKRGHFVAWWPNFHWTDQKLHIHAFYCVLSLLFVSLAHRQVWHAGIEIGLPTVEKELKAIKEVMTLQLPPSGKLAKAKLFRKLTTMTEQQQAIFEALELEDCAPPT